MTLTQSFKDSLNALSDHLCVFMSHHQFLLHLWQLYTIFYLWQSQSNYRYLFYSSTLAWKIPWTEEPGGMQSMGLLRVGHDFTFTFTFHFVHWRRKWQPTPVFLPGESQGRESLVGCCQWDRTESDTTEAT